MISSHSTPIPRNVVAYVGGVDIDTTSYALYKDGHVLVIQAEPIKTPTQGLSPDAILANRDKEYYWGLEKIQSRLNSIDFSRTSWAYLTTRANGDYHIVPRARPRLPLPTCATWAPLVEEKDIRYTKWLSCEKRCGLWKGMDVDVFIGWDNLWLKEVYGEMQTYRLLQGLDVTYDILAHVVDDSGQVIGIVREPAVGRAVEYGDRALVYKTIAGVQQRRMVFRGLAWHNLLIKDGKLRVLDIGLVKCFREDEQEAMQKKAQSSHWRSLEIMFDGLKIRPNPPPMRTWTQNLEIFFSFPNPEKPLLITIYITANCEVDDEDENDSRAHRRINRDRRSGARLPFFGIDCNVGPPEVSAVVDRPLHGISLHPRRAQPNAFQPYRPRPASRKLLTAPENISSETHSPIVEIISRRSTGTKPDGDRISSRHKTTIPHGGGVRTARRRV